MIVYVLTKQYSDRSAFMVCGVTENIKVAQAFESGGKNAEPMPTIYQIETEDALMPDGHPALQIVGM